MIVSTLYSSGIEELRFKLVDQDNIARVIDVGCYIDGMLLERVLVSNVGQKIAVHRVRLPESELFTEDSFVYLRDEESGTLISCSVTKLSDLLEFPKDDVNNKKNLEFKIESQSIKEFLRG